MSQHKTNPYQSPGKQAAATGTAVRADALLDALATHEFSFFELLLATSRTIRRYFLAMAGPALMLAVPLGILNAGWLSLVHERLKPFLLKIVQLSNRSVPNPMNGPGHSNSLQPIWSAITRDALQEIAFITLFYLAMQFMLAAGISMLVAMQIEYRLQVADHSQAFHHVRHARKVWIEWLRRLPVLLFLFLPLLLLQFVLTALCLVPGWLSFAYISLVPIAVGLHPRPLQSISVLIESMRGRLGRTLMLFSIITLVFLMVGMLMPLPILASFFPAQSLQTSTDLDLAKLVRPLLGHSNLIKLFLLQYIQALPQAFYYTTLAVAATIVYCNAREHIKQVG